MAARKKKRSKAYRPKAVKAPNHLLVKLLPELTKEEHTKIELASLLPLDAIRRGEGTLENVDYVMNSLHVCWVCSAAFERQTKIDAQSLMMVAYGCMRLVSELIQSGKADQVPGWMIEPVQPALELLADMQAEMSRAEMLDAYEAMFRARKHLCNPESAAAIRPDDPSTWEKPYMHHGLMYLHGIVQIGFLEERDGQIFWWAYDTQTLIRITHPAVMLVSIPLTQEERIEFLNGRTS